jgi:septal ring factor EnvC (AmiA/AmiB activator)
MTPSEHDKRQAESDAGMEQWEEGRAQRLRAFSEVMTEFPTIHRELVAAADHIDALRAKIERLRAEVATLRRKAEAFDAVADGEVALYRNMPCKPYEMHSDGLCRVCQPEEMLTAIEALLKKATP